MALMGGVSSNNFNYDSSRQYTKQTHMKKLIIVCDLPFVAICDLDT